MISEDAIFSVASSTLPTYRQRRARGDDGALVLAAFPAPDAEMVSALYALLGELAEALRSDAVVSSAIRSSFRDRIAVLLRAHGGLATVPMSEVVAQALHDVRGGAMTALLFGLSELSTSRRRGFDEAALLALIRDQRKIIRSIVRDLDPEARIRDATNAPHSLADLEAGVSNFARERGGRSVAIDIHRAVDAVVAESCLEFAALERAVFNLLNNAVRHAEGDDLDVWLLVVGTNARVVVVNSVTQAQERSIASALDANPASLYAGFTTTGSGLGLGIVADIVGNAYGLDETEQLVGDGYIGTRIMDHSFVSWLHWPLAS